MRRLAPWVLLAALLGLWQLVTALRLVEPFLLPPPAEVAARFWQALTEGLLWKHARATLLAALAGLASGLVAGVALGYAIARHRLLEEALAPLIVSLQATPVVAWAPLLVIWFGSGPGSKVLTCALIVFFPMLMNTVVGFRNVPPALRDLLRAQRATRRQTLLILELPAAMPVLFGGLKISATLAVIGVVVGEFVSADAGLGLLITLARNQYDTPLALAGVFTLTFMARLLYGAVVALERRALAWQGGVAEPLRTTPDDREGP